MLEQNENIMAILTLEVFTSVIESIRLQIEKDKDASFNLEKALKLDEGTVCLYDNELLIKSLIKLLQVHFPKKGDHCDIEHYMFDMNFGKIGEEELITIEHLWLYLNQPPIVSTHPLIDEVSLEDYQKKYSFTCVGKTKESNN